MHQFIFENASNGDFEMIDHESGEMESTEKKQLGKKMLFEAIDLI